MVKNTINALFVVALLAGTTQAMEDGRMTEEQFNHWLAEQAIAQTEEEEFARAMQESALQYEQQQQKQDVAAHLLENQNNVISELAQKCSNDLDDNGLRSSIQNNYQVKGFTGPLKKHLESEDLEQLVKLRSSNNFNNFNDNVKNVIDLVIINKECLNDFPILNKINGQESPHVSYVNFFPEHKYLHVGENLFCTNAENTCGPKKFELENSSGADNCCLLFSIIGNNAILYAKVMEISEQDAHNWLNANPELSGVSELDCIENNVNKRKFQDLRAKFFERIIENFDAEYPLQNGQLITVRNFLERNFKENMNINELFFINGESFVETLNVMQIKDQQLEIFFATVFGWLYDVKVVVLNGTIGNAYLENANKGHPELMPMITANDFPNMIYVYVGGDMGGHYQKLKVLG